MSLIKCKECGKEISDKASHCPNCGCPNFEQNKTKQDNKPNKGNGKSGRLIISILMLIFSTIVLFQSCAVGMANTLENSDALDGSIGFIVALFMIILGVSGVVTKNTDRYGSLRILSIISVLIGLYCWFIYEGIYEDLKVWSWLFFIHSIIFSLSANKIKKFKGA